MTGKQRIYAAFEHREADVVPRFEQSVSSDVASVLLGREAFTGTVYLHYQETLAWLDGEAAHAEFVERHYQDLIELTKLLKLDMMHPAWRFERRPTRRINEVDFLYGDPDGDYEVRRYDPASKTFGVLKSVSRDAADPYDMDAFARRIEKEERHADEFAVGDPAAAWPFMARMQAEHGDEYAVTGAAGLSVGLDEGSLAACAMAPELIARRLDAQATVAIKCIDAQAAMGLRVIWGGGDLADKNGPMYGPRVFRELVLPRYQRLARRCHELGCWYVFRSDGNLWPIEQELFVDSGIDGYGEIDHEAGMTLERLKPLHGGRLCFWGNVPAGSVMIHGTPAEVRDFARRLIDIAAPGGGFILGTSNSVIPNTPPENVAALFEAAEG